MSFTLQQLQTSCHEKAFHLYGTHYIYSLRARSKERYTQAITLLGFLIPVIVGGVISSYGLNSDISAMFLKVLTPLAIIQLALSTLALVYKWDDQKSYYLESSISNRQLFEDFTNLAKFPQVDIKDNEHLYQILMVKAQMREDQDDRYPFTAKEQRKGMRYSLRQYQKACSGCSIVPTAMDSTNCDVCGKFKLINI
jgi:mobilome CxxCx(11)CxxC protein